LEYNGMGCEPIPISKELLEKFGFEELGKDPTIEEQNYRKDIWGYADKYFDIKYNLVNNTFTLNFITGPCIEYKYVHELQNLYYFLVGCELLIHKDMFK